MKKKIRQVIKRMVKDGVYPPMGIMVNPDEYEFIINSKKKTK